MQAVHDIPVLGVFTKSFADGFGYAIWAGPEEEKIQEAFDKFAKSGKLDQGGTAEALRELEMAERQINTCVRNMPKEGVDLEGFKGLATRQPMRVPVLGNIYTAAGSFTTESFDTTVMPLCAPVPTDKSLREIFQELDLDGSGTLDKEELANCLRKLWWTEGQIKDKVDESKAELNFYEFRQMMLGGKYNTTWIDNVPVVGPALHSHLVPYPEIPPEDVRAAFDQIDKNKNGKLDRTEIGDTLRELGRSEFQVQRLVDAMPMEELDFEGFCELMEEKQEARPSLHWVHDKVPLPNPARLHDAPVIGRGTRLGHDIAHDAWRHTVGAYLRNFVIGGNQPEEEEQVLQEFKDFDTDHDGILSEKEAANLLRKLGRSEYQIKFFRDAMQDRSKGVTAQEFETIYWCWL